MTPDPPILGLAFLLGRCTEEWKGPWSDDSKEWTDEAKEKFDLKVKDDAGPKICIMHTNFQRWENAVVKYRRLRGKKIYGSEMMSLH